MLTVHQTVSDVRGNFYQEKTVFLRCTVNSNPPARFIWKRGSDTLSHSQDNGVDIYEPLYTQVRMGSGWPGLLMAHPTLPPAPNQGGDMEAEASPSGVLGTALAETVCSDIRHYGADEIGTKAQGTVMGTGESSGQQVLLEHCQLGEAPPRGRQVIPARCWLSEYWNPLGRHSRRWGQRDDSTSHRPPTVPRNGDEAILAGRAFKGGFPR